MNPPPPGHPGWGYPPPGYGPPPGPQPYGAYPPYPPPPAYPPYPPPAPKPGVVPLHPLSVIDIFSGALGYIRANPKVTVGLTALTVVATQLISLVVVAVLLGAIGDPSTPGLSGGALAAALAVGTIVTALGTIVLVGMLTVVVSRAVSGATITIGEAWAVARERFWPLLGLTGVLGAAAAVLIGGLMLFMTAAAGATSAVGAVIIGFPLALAVAGLLAYGYTAVSFAATAVVLERLPVFAAITRSYHLVRGNFWRVLGILALAGLIAYLVTTAVALPFNIVGLLAHHGPVAPMGQPNLLAALGTTIGQIIVAPFTAGVVVLLYTDRRIRAEGFDQALRAGPPPGWSPDGLWLTRPPG